MTNRKMRLFIVGVSCVGKTAIGLKLSELLEYHFFDLDDEIERFFSEPIERLQERFFNMDRYRKAGAKVLVDILDRELSNKAVIALPPSGLMDHYWNVVKRYECLTVVLKDRPENILNRIDFFDKDSRKIQLKLDKKKKNYYLKEIRKDIQYFGRSYKKADIILDISGLNVNQGALATKKAIEEFGWEHSSPKNFVTKQASDFLGEKGFEMVYQKERNVLFSDLEEKTAIAILNGLSIAKASKEFGMTKIECRKILDSFCLKSAHFLYEKLQKYPLERPAIGKLREHSPSFIEGYQTLKNVEIDSPIWALPDVPMMTLNAMWNRKVFLIGDILKFNQRELLLFKQFGKLGLKKLIASLNRYGFSLKG